MAAILTLWAAEFDGVRDVRCSAPGRVCGRPDGRLRGTGQPARQFRGDLRLLSHPYQGLRAPARADRDRPCGTRPDTRPPRCTQGWPVSLSGEGLATDGCWPDAGRLLVREHRKCIGEDREGQQAADGQPGADRGRDPLVGGGAHVRPLRVLGSCLVVLRVHDAAIAPLSNTGCTDRGLPPEPSNWADTRQSRHPRPAEPRAAPGSSRQPGDLCTVHCLGRGFGRSVVRRPGKPAGGGCPGRGSAAPRPCPGPAPGYRHRCLGNTGFRRCRRRCGAAGTRTRPSTCRILRRLRAAAATAERYLAELEGGNPLGGPGMECAEKDNPCCGQHEKMGNGEHDRHRRHCARAGKPKGVAGTPPRCGAATP